MTSADRKKHHPECPWLKGKGANCGFPCSFSDKSNDPEYIRQIIYGLKMQIKILEAKYWKLI